MKKILLITSLLFAFATVLSAQERVRCEQNNLFNNSFEQNLGSAIEQDFLSRVGKNKLITCTMVDFKASKENEKYIVKYTYITIYFDPNTKNPAGTNSSMYDGIAEIKNVKGNFQITRVTEQKI